MTNGHVTKKDLREAIESIAAVIATDVGSLHTDIQQSEARLRAKLDEMNARLDTHAGML